MTANTEVQAPDDLMQRLETEKLPEFIPIKDIPEDVKDMFSRAKTLATIASPLLAHLMYQCEFNLTKDESCETVKAIPVDEKNHVVFNYDYFVNTLQSDEERAFMCFHPVLHIFLQHVGRQVDNGYDANLWDVATDFNVNLTCAGYYKTESGEVRQASRYTNFMKAPKGALLDTRFVGMSADEIYHQLAQENQNNSSKAAEQYGASSGYSPANGQGKNGQSPMDKVGVQAPSQGQQQRNIQSAVTAATAAQMSKQIGENEADLVKHIDAMGETKIDYREKIANSIISSVKEMTTYNRLSRRTEGDVVFPVQYGKTINIVFGIDSSGSMGADDYQDSATELKSVLDQFESWKVFLISCDTNAHLLGIYSSEDGDDFTTFDMNIIGGGGTRMGPMVDYAIEAIDMGEELNATIILTDGYIPEDDIEKAASECEVPTIVIVTRNGNKNLKLNNSEVILID